MTQTFSFENFSEDDFDDIEDDDSFVFGNEFEDEDELEENDWQTVEDDDEF